MLPVILTLVVSMAIPPTLFQNNEIDLLVSKAPVLEAAADPREGSEWRVILWLRALAYSGRVKEAFAVADKIKKNKGGFSREDALYAIGWGLALAGQVDEAMAVTSRLKKSNSNEFSLLILIAGDKTDEALAEARKTKTEEDRARFMLTIVKIMIVKGEVDRALATAAEIEDESSLEDAYEYIAKELAASGKVTEAISTANRIKDDTTRRIALESALQTLIEAGKQDEALALAQSITPDGANSIVAAAMQKLNEEKISRETTVAPGRGQNSISDTDRVDYVESLVKAGKLDEAKTEAEKIEADYERCQAFGQIAFSLALSHSYAEARQIADRCTSPAIRLAVYTVILTEHSTAANPQLKARLEMEKRID